MKQMNNVQGNEIIPLDAQRTAFQYTDEEPEEREVEISNSFFDSLLPIYVIAAVFIFISGVLVGYMFFYRRGHRGEGQPGSAALKDKEHPDLKNEEDDDLSGREDTSVSNYARKQNKEYFVGEFTAAKGTKLVEDFQSVFKDIQVLIDNSNKSSRLSRNLERSLIGLSDKVPGFTSVINSWKQADKSGQLNVDTILRGLNEIEIRKGLASLYALSRYAHLGNVASYYEKKNISSKELERIVDRLFNSLKINVGVEFDLPKFGASFDEERFNLIDKNFGPIYDIDAFALSKLLDESANFSNPQPIIDVGELGLVSAPESTQITLKYPAKTSVGYYTKS